MRLVQLLTVWFLPVFLISLGLGVLVFFNQNDILSFVSYVLLILGVSLLLVWATSEDKKTTSCRPNNLSGIDISADSSIAVKLRSDLDSRIREAADFKAELEAKRAEIAALKSGLNRTDAAELNEAIAQLYIDFEFERGRAEGDFSKILAGLLESVDSLFAAAALVKGAPTPGERFVDQPAGSCKVFKTELSSEAAMKGTIMAVRSPWVGFMANGKLKVIIASNVSVYA